MLERWIPARLKPPELQTARSSVTLTSSNYRLSTSLKLTTFNNKHLDQVPVDLERLSELSRGDIEFQRELLQVFLEDAVVYIEELKIALAAGDLTTIARRAHQLKGTSATVAIFRMPEISAQLERQAQENQLLGAGDILTELGQILERVQAFITG